MDCASKSAQEEEGMMNSTRYCTKVKTEECHFQWRIENFRETINPSSSSSSASIIIPEALLCTVEVGESLGAKMRISLELEEHSPRPRPLASSSSSSSSVQYTLNGNQLVLFAQSDEVVQPGAIAIRQLPGEGPAPRRARAGGLARLYANVPDSAHLFYNVAALGGQQQQDAAGAVGDDETSNSSYLNLIVSLNDLEFEVSGEEENDMPLLKRIQIYIKKRSGGDYYLNSLLQEPEHKVQSFYYTFKDIIETTPTALEQLMLVDEALIVEIKLTVSKVADANAAELRDFESSIAAVVSDAIPVARRGYSDTVTLTCRGNNSEDEEGKITICSSKAVLSVRSSSLAGMFHRNPKQDKFNLDMSKTTFSTMLKYLHTGKLPAQMFSSYLEVLDLAIAAQQYGVNELFHYCDEILAPFCSMETASDLLRKTRECRLFKSSQAIMEYIKAHSDRVTTVGSRSNSVGLAAAETNQEPRPGIMNHNYTLKEIVTTGVMKETYPFTWEIHRFKEVIQSRQSKTAKFDNRNILTGCGNWNSEEPQWNLSACGEEVESGRKIRLQIQCKCDPESVQKLTHGVWFYFGVALQSPSVNSSMIWSPLKRARDASEVKILLKKEDAPLAAASGSLSLKLQLIVLTSQLDESRNIKGCKIFRTFCDNATEKLERDMESLYKTQPVFTDVTIISKEGHQFYAHWRFLAARCAAFKSMFESWLEERLTGVIKLPDVPRNAVDVMLAFIYTGRIPADRFVTAADILDVAYVAEKYELVDLKRYCDEHLAEKCNLRNASELLAGATMYRLTEAQGAIKKFIKRNAGPGMDHADVVADLAPESAGSNP